MEDESIFLDVAHRIGTRLIQAAKWKGDACTWHITTVDRNSPGERRTVLEEASGAVYRGTAGIALFLSELYDRTRDEKIGRTAVGALRHALAATEELPENSFSFYNGRVGTAYAAVWAAKRLQKPAFEERAAEALDPLYGNETQDHGLDVLTGGAGAIPALIHLARRLGTQEPADMAVRLGEHLIREAHIEPGGWSWGSPQPTKVRHLVGFGHGTAGFVYAFLELYQTTGEERFRYAGEQAALYERQFFDEKFSNWPDFRYHELIEYFLEDKRDELREDLLSEELVPYTWKHMRAWCHGGPGIGLTRLRAFSLLGEEEYRKEAEDGIRSAKVAVESWTNYSLCHGLGGNCETLLYAAEVFEDESLRKVPEMYGRLGAERFEYGEEPWPCGTVNGIDDPSFMLGEAGIGYFYLRLDEPETPSLLLLRPSHEAGARQSGPLPTSERVEALRHRYVKTYFEKTHEALEALREATSAAPQQPAGRTPETSEAERYYRALREKIDHAAEPLRSLVEDASRTDRARYEMTRALDDFTKSFVDQVLRPPVEEIQWESSPVQLGPQAYIVRNAYDWDAWLDQPASQRPARPQPSEVTYLLHCSSKRIHLRRLGPFATLVLTAVETPASLKEITDRVLEALAGSPPRRAVQAKIVEQLGQAYQWGVVRAPHEPSYEHPPAQIQRAM